MPETAHLVPSKVFTFLFFLFIFVSVSISAQVYPDKKADALLQKGINYLVYEDYQNASRTFEELKKQFPKLPLGWMYSAATEYSRANDLFLPLDEGRGLRDLDFSLELTKNLLNSQPNNPWNHYFMGLARGFKAVYQSQDGNWLGAISTGLSAVSSYEKCLELDSNFSEAYVAVGTYRYWKGDKLGYLEWLPFVGGSKQSGIPLIRKGLSSFCYNEYSGLVTLFWIYMNEKDYKSARGVAEKGLEKFKGSMLYRKLYARALEEIEPGKAIAIYREILDDYRKAKLSNRCLELFYKYSLASTYRKNKEYQSAIALCNEIIGMAPLSAFEKDRVGEKYDKAVKLKASLGGR